MSEFERKPRVDKTPIRLAVLGAGTVGGGVIKYFQEGKGEEFGIQLTKVAVSNPHKPRSFESSSITTDVREIFEDPNINIVVELIGGISPAREFIRRAIEGGKSVVTANKAVLAGYAQELFKEARLRNVDIAYEASVGGGIPIIRVLRGFRGEKIDRIMGILNGTTNYILTRMEEGMDLQRALSTAQEKGFAEANHLLDTGGFDSRDKLALLASLVYNAQIDPETIECTGITDITPADIDFAAKYGIEEGGRGYAIKLLAVAEREHNNTLGLRVHPALIRRDHPLAVVRDEFNAVHITGNLAGEQMYQGRGAGRNATTSAVISDILRVAQNIRDGKTDELPTLDSPITLKDPGERAVEGYMRVNLKHAPGSAAHVFQILAAHGLNIKDSLQRRSYGEEVNGDIFIPDIITVEQVSQRIIEEALKETDKSERTHGKAFFLQFEQ